MQKRFGEAAYNAARSEMLLPEERGYIEVEGMEKTYKITQERLKKEVDITTAQKVHIPRSMKRGFLRCGRLTCPGI